MAILLKYYCKLLKYYCKADAVDKPLYFCCSNFTEWVDFIDWWSFIGKACLSNKLFNMQTPSLILEWDEPGSDISPMEMEKQSVLLLRRDS